MLVKTIEDACITDEMMVDILGALSFSRNDVSRFWGKVWPFSQMSTSFLIFSYTWQNILVSFSPIKEMIREAVGMAI